MSREGKSRVSPPGPRHTLGYRSPRSFTRDRLSTLRNLCRTYGDCCRFRLGFREAYFLNHPEYIRQLLVSEQKSVRRSAVTQLTSVVLGGSVFNATGELHHQQRKRLGSALHSDQIQRYHAIIREEVVRTQEHWRHGDVISVLVATRRLALAIASRALLGLDLSPESENINTALRSIFPSVNRFDHPLQWFSWILPSPANVRILKAILRLNSIAQHTIRQAEQHPGNGTLLAMLLDARDRGEVSRRLVRDETMFMMLAGHEATSQGLMWTLYLLSLHPEVEAQLHSEVDTVFEREQDQIAPGLLEFTGRVVKEALRLYPPSPIIDRYTRSPIDLGQFQIPAWRTIFVSPYITHRDERFFADPLKFDPQRWSDPACARTAGSYFPFGLGPRRCLGEFFALAEITLAVAQLCHDWKFHNISKEPVEAEALVTLRAKNEIRLRVERR